MSTVSDLTRVPCCPAARTGLRWPILRCSGRSNCRMHWPRSRSSPRRGMRRASTRSATFRAAPVVGWNGRFRDDIRRFVAGTGGLVGEVASRIAGSSDIFHLRAARQINSVNFVTCHDGFTLNDLVSYNGKHNEANGEGNRDGNNDNTAGTVVWKARPPTRRSRTSVSGRSRTSPRYCCFPRACRC